MSQDLQKAKQYLHTQGYTFVAVKNEDLFVSQKRGVAPLLEQIDSNTLLNGFSVADKVVGKASAFLYLLLQPAAVYTDLISLPALELLRQNNIPIEYKDQTQAIRNRTNTGFCPMETAVQSCHFPQEALHLIRQTIIRLKKEEHHE